MRIVIEVQDGRTTVTADDEQVGLEQDGGEETRCIGFEPPQPPQEDEDSYIGE